MTAQWYRFIIGNEADFKEAEATLHLAILAAEGLYGESRVRMDVSYRADERCAAILINGGTATGDALVRIFTSLLSREYGPDSFSVRRAPVPQPTMDAAPSGAAA